MRPTIWHHHDSKTLTHVHPISVPKISTVRSGHRRGLRVLAFGLVALGICVFAWGLKYKLSLYDPPHALSHHMPEAKLLSGRERVELPVVRLRNVFSPGAPLALSALALTLLVLFRARFGVPPASSTRMFAGAHLAAQFSGGKTSFSRPPPSLR